MYFGTSSTPIICCKTFLCCSFWRNVSFIQCLWNKILPLNNRMIALICWVQSIRLQVPRKLVSSPRIKLPMPKVIRCTFACTFWLVVVYLYVVARVRPILLMRQPVSWGKPSGSVVWNFRCSRSIPCLMAVADALPSQPIPQLVMQELLVYVNKLWSLVAWKW